MPNAYVRHFYYEFSEDKYIKYCATPADVRQTLILMYQNNIFQVNLKQIQLLYMFIIVFYQSFQAIYQKECSYIYTIACLVSYIRYNNKNSILYLYNIFKVVSQSITKQISIVMGEYSVCCTNVQLLHTGFEFQYFTVYQIYQCS